ncbi:MAG TPA: helix-turn-helix domain-containing protein [Kofleriaceae bacterium]|jgi:DNA-binding transcriptional ArsR family regulator|nr:helix-turn-helix domain-containing protein [Kofleriaceae bacterium]
MTRRTHPAPRLDPDIAQLAGALADPSRIAMLDALLDGSARPIGALARRAGISAATASGHLRRLVDHQLVVVDRDGPTRRVRLAGPAVAELLESIAAHAHAVPAASAAPGAPPRTAAATTAARELRFARTCYDHLAGVVGVGVTRALLARRWLRTAGDGFTAAPALLGWLADHGRGLADEPRSRRPLVRACLDWSERTPHVAGRVGAAIADLALARQWVVRVRDSRALRLTGRGRAALAAELALTL